MRFIHEDLNLDDAAIAAHLRELKNSQVASDYPAQFNFLYESLGILDSKASSLLTFNAVGMAALAIWMESMPRDYFHLALDVAFLLFLISCIFCLKIVWVYWAGTADLKRPDTHTVELLRLRESRTITYRRAWLQAVLAVAITGVATIYHTVETAVLAWRHAG